MDIEKENLEIVENLKKLKTISSNINSLCDYQHNFCFFKAVKGDMYLMWASMENNIEIYDMNKEMLVDTVKGHDDYINSCQHFFNPLDNKDYLITCSDDKTIKIWEFLSEKEIHNKKVCYIKSHLIIKQDTIGYFRNAVMFTDFRENKNYLIVELSDYMISIYNEKGQYIRKIDPCLFYDIWTNDKKGKTYIVTSYLNKIKLYDYKTGLIWKEILLDGKVLSIALVNNLMIVSDDLGLIKSFNIETSEVVNVQKENCAIHLVSVWDIEYVFGATEEGKVICYETKTFTKVRTIDNLLCDKIIQLEAILHPRYGPTLVIAGSNECNKGLLSFLTLQNLS